MVRLRLNTWGTYLCSHCILPLRYTGIKVYSWIGFEVISKSVSKTRIASGSGKGKGHG